MAYDYGRMVTKRSETRTVLAAEVWRRIFDFLVATHEQRDRVLARLGLTVGDSKALTHLDNEEGQSMGALATAWSCDASNATWMVDRLEQRGLVERRPVAGDRRVKVVVLTAEGVEMKAALMDALYEPPEVLAQMSREDLAALRSALERLPDVEHLRPKWSRRAANSG